MNHETGLLPLISERVHPEIVLLILIIYWQRTAQPQRSKFSQWDVRVVGGRETSRKKHTDTVHMESSFLNFKTWNKCCWPTVVASCGAYCLFATQTLYKTKYAEIHVVCGELNMRRKLRSLPVRWQHKLTPSKMHCVAEQTSFPAFQKQPLWFTDLPFLLGSYYLFLAKLKVQAAYL